MVAELLWDERCPKCIAALDMPALHVDNDYETRFTFECPRCEAKLYCLVVMVPEFGLRLAEDDDIP
jgi:hypothetical protein